MSRRHSSLASTHAAMSCSQSFISSGRPGQIAISARYAARCSLGRISPWWSMSRCSSSASRRSPGSYDDPSRLQSSRSALGATAAIGSCWTSVSRSTTSSRSVGRGASSSCARTAIRRACSTGQPAHQASTPSGSPCGSSAPPSHDAIGSGGVAPSPSSSRNSGSRGSSAPSELQLGAPHGHHDRRRQARVGRHDAVVRQHLLQGGDLGLVEGRVVGDPDRAVLEVVHGVLVAQPARRRHRRPASPGRAGHPAAAPARSPRPRRRGARC